MKDKAASIHNPSASTRPSRLGDWPRSGADGGISTLSRCHAGPTPAKMRFSCDSPLEGDGFEPSVPGTKEPVFVAEGELRDRTGAAKKGCFLCGTDGSNPSPSSGESCANLSLAGIRLPTSRSRGFRGCAGRGERRGRQRRAGRGNIVPRGGNISVGLYSSTAPPVMWAA